MTELYNMRSWTPLSGPYALWRILGPNRRLYEGAWGLEAGCLISPRVWVSAYPSGHTRRISRSGPTGRALAQTIRNYLDNLED